MESSEVAVDHAPSPSSPDINASLMTDDMWSSPSPRINMHTKPSPLCRKPIEYVDSLVDWRLSSSSHMQFDDMMLICDADHQPPTPHKNRQSKRRRHRRRTLDAHLSHSSSDSDEDSCASNVNSDADTSDARAAAERQPLPYVEPDLLAYFTCNLCDASDFNSLPAYFDHLWREHTELQAVGGRVGRVPVRLRPQLFVTCALCGAHNTGSAGEDGDYLTRHHLPLHEQLVSRVEAAAAAARTPSTDADTENANLACVCDECGALFARPGLLSAHQASTTHKSVVHECRHCRLSVCGNQAYIAHLCEHFITCRVACYFCQSRFSSEATCVAHVKHHHPHNYHVHRCGQCGYNTALLHDFVTHVRAHVQPGRYVCHVCAATFVSKASLRDHLHTHTCGQFPCGACGRVFAHPQTLRRHQVNAHDRPQQCVCPECGRQFVSVYSMKRHRMTHQGLKPHQCDKCGRGYVQRNDLKLHTRRCKYANVSTPVYCGS